MTPLTDERPVELATKIKPVFNNDTGNKNKGLAYMKPVDLKQIAFTFDPKATESAEDLTAISALKTTHTYGAPSLFKPSLAEVYTALNDLPEKELEGIVAFSTALVSENARDCFTADGERHVAVTTLYAGNLPENIAQQPVILNNKPAPPLPRTYVLD